MRTTHLIAPALALLLGAGTARAGEVRIVDHPRLGGFATLQAAVDAAVDGDVLLVGGGTYAGFTVDGKAVWVIEAPGSTVRITGTVTVRNLAAQQSVLLDGLHLDAGNGPGLQLESNVGNVRVQDAQIDGGWVATSQGAGEPGILASASQRVILVGCVVRGKDAAWQPGYFGERGGHGIEAVDTAIALYDTNVFGGDGGEEGAPSGGDAGDGCNVNGWGIFASGCIIRGGRGGGGDFIGCNTGGDGGDGLDVTAAQARLLDNTLTGGSGGGGFCAPNGTPGMTIRSNGALVDLLPGTRRKLTAPVLAGDDSGITLVLTGQPGDLFHLLVWHAPSYGFVKAVNGVWAVPLPFFAGVVPLGTVPGSGTLGVAVRPPDVRGASAVRTLYLQGICTDTTGKTFLTSARHLALLDVRGMPDCNANSVIDYLDTTTLGGPDCDENLVPDSCDPDCDANGTPDACDIAQGTQSDCNQNGVPDSCDISSGASGDCNGNSIPDSCDISSGTSMDANQNGIPDECEMNFLTFHVDAAAAPGGNGTAGMPYRSIGEALAVTVGGDRVLVRDGVYNGPDNRDMDLAGRDIVVESVNGPAACIIDCENLGRAFVWQPVQGNAPCADLTVRGFTIRRGRSDEFGGAMRLHCGTVSECVIEDCSAATGGALFLGRRGVVEDTLFTNNTAVGGSFLGPDGGAIYSIPDYSYLQDAPTTVRRCVFVSNHADVGGAIRLVRHANHAVSHNVFLDNTATLFGGGLAIECRTTQPALGIWVDDNLFAGNTAGTHGGGIYAKSPFGTADVRISGSTFADNTAIGGVGGGLAVYNSDGFGAVVTTLDNSVFWNNAATAGGQIALFRLGGGSVMPQLTVTYTDAQGGQPAVHVSGGLLTWGAGNLAADPLFADPDGPDNDPLTLADNDYRLGALSPCTDAGDVGAIPPDVTDVDGDGDTTEPVPFDLDLLGRRADDPAVPDTGVGPAPVVDLGAYERRP